MTDGLTPRERLNEISDAEIDEATGGLSGFLIRRAVAQLDAEAPGGISAPATLIAALTVRTVDRHRGPPPEPLLNPRSSEEARRAMIDQMMEQRPRINFGPGILR